MEPPLIRRVVRKHSIRKGEFVGVISFPVFFTGEMVLIKLLDKEEPRILLEQSFEAVAYLPKENIGEVVEIKLPAAALINYATLLLERKHGTNYSRHSRR